jgi:hypothetical protein
MDLYAAVDRPEGADATMSATLRLTRRAVGLELRHGPFEVLVDGTNVGEITYKKTVETPLEPGHHTLQLRTGRYCSPDQPFEIAPDEVVNFRCHGAVLWPRYVASIIKPDLAISLRREYVDPERPGA